MARWLLPENISDVLPVEARRIERLRRRLMDLYQGYGYELVIPPLVEHIDSLLTGSGRDLDLSTLKLVDQGSGRTLGLRADVTPQVSRIDSHILNRAGVVRLCYALSSLHARPAHPLANREPLQVGAELYGEPGLAGDREILDLAVRSLRLLDIPAIQIDMGHTAIVRALFDRFGAGSAAQAPVLSALTSKDPGALDQACLGFDAEGKAAFGALLSLHGDAGILDSARKLLPGLPTIVRALDELAGLARMADLDRGDCAPVRVSFDLADLHGFRYHTGFTFAAFAPGIAGALLRGGRYDDVGAAFGRSRHATGFSLLDLREAASLGVDEAPLAMFAPGVEDEALSRLVQSLRARGEIVVAGSGSGGDRPALGGSLCFDRRIVASGSQWQVVAWDPAADGT